ncbi:unnamed protein product [Parnassius apollo]|uniref:(apollo) hypothetical protein n=1 Tax=Parnassius apollo TaxID=110799 RepID=A0A8S3XPY3_PARAO|nr:unnamed protein product [Parnassius apollo]
MGQGNGGALWQKLAEIGLYNKGITLKQKSTLNWRDVYINSLLWLNHMDTIDITLVESIKIQHVRNIHVYKGNIIVVGDSDVKFYNVHTFEVRKILQKSCIDYQESDHITVERNERNISVGLKHNMTGFTFKGLFFKLIDDRCYIVDDNCVLWRITCCNKKEINSLLRTYGGNESIVDINIYENDVFVLMRNGIVYHGTGTCTEFEMVRDLNTSDFYKCPVLAMFQKFSVAYSLPVQNGSISESDDEFLKTVDMSDEILMACPGLCCATAHGDILFLGYEDGKIVIRTRRNREISYMKLNMWDIEDPIVGGTAIKAIDVCEENQCEEHFT